MRAISLWQPWAHLVAVGAKKFETRSWETWHRGVLAIHAAKKWTQVLAATASDPYFNLFWKKEDAAFGAIIAVCKVIACAPAPDFLEIIKSRTQDVRFVTQQIVFGDWGAGRYAWELAEVVRLKEPVYCRGRQSMWDLPEEVNAKIQEQL